MLACRTPISAIPARLFTRTLREWYLEIKYREKSLQRICRGDTLYVLDETTTELHASDVDRLTAQLSGLVDLGNTVIIVEHDAHVVAGSDWVIDIGPGAGDAGGRVAAAARLVSFHRWAQAARHRTLAG